VKVNGWPILLLSSYAFFSMLSAPAAGADPSQGPLIDDNTIRSANGRFVARPDAKEKSTVIFRRDDSGGLTKSWTMTGWSVWDSLSDDGDYLVRCREESGRRTRKTNEVMLSIYRRGTLISSVRFGEIVLDQNRLVDPRRWGECKGFVSIHCFVLETLERRRLNYDVTTGTLISATTLPDLAPESKSRQGTPSEASPIGLPGKVGR
jgi:hypothetical protein